MLQYICVAVNNIWSVLLENIMSQGTTDMDNQKRIGILIGILLSLLLSAILLSAVISQGIPEEWTLPIFLLFSISGVSGIIMGVYSWKVALAKVVVILSALLFICLFIWFAWTS